MFIPLIFYAYYTSDCRRKSFSRGPTPSFLLPAERILPPFWRSRCPVRPLSSLRRCLTWLTAGEREESNPPPAKKRARERGKKELNRLGGRRKAKRLFFLISRPPLDSSDFVHLPRDVKIRPPFPLPLHLLPPRRKKSVVRKPFFDPPASATARCCFCPPCISP